MVIGSRFTTIEESQWEAYVNGDYKITITNESKQLGGGTGKKTSDLNEPFSMEETTETKEERFIS